MVYVGVQPKKFSARFAHSNICTPHSQNCGAAPDTKPCLHFWPRQFSQVAIPPVGIQARTSFIDLNSKNWMKYIARLQKSLIIIMRSLIIILSARASVSWVLITVSLRLSAVMFTFTFKLFDWPTYLPYLYRMLTVNAKMLWRALKQITLVLCRCDRRRSICE